jgi:tetratricopeptide (TPR) repeat protein
MKNKFGLLVVLLGLVQSATLFAQQVKDAKPKTAAEKSAETYWAEGEKFRDAGDYPKAIEAYKKVIAAAPESAFAADAYHGIGWIEIDQKEYRAAVTSVSEALRLRPNDAEINFELGEAFLFIGVNARAISLFKQAIALQPDFVDAYYNMGMAYDLMGDKASALEVCKKLRTLDKKTAQNLCDQIQQPK